MRLTVNLVCCLPRLGAEPARQLRLLLVARANTPGGVCPPWELALARMTPDPVARSDAASRAETRAAHAFARP